MPESRPVSRSQFLVVTAVLLAFAVSWPAIFWRGGLLELETISFVTNYSAERPLPAKIFDPRINDFGNYQARELSYVVDYVDAMVYRRLASASHRPFFVPFSTLVSSALLVVLFMSGVRRTTRHLDALTAGALLACLLTSFQFVFTMGMFYRSSKPVLAVALLALLFLIVRTLQQQPEKPAEMSAPGDISSGLAAFALSLLCGLMDRQGFYYVIVASILLAIHRVTSRQGASLLAGTCAALIVLVLYDLVVAPALILSLNGYQPDFSMQNIALGRGSLVAQPWRVLQAFQVLAENIGVMLGGFRFAGLLILTAFLVLGIAGMSKAATVAWRYALLAGGLQLLMFGLMIQKLPEIHDWIDHRYWYYPLPFLVTVIFLLAIGLDTLMPRIPPHRRWIIPAALLLAAAGNLASLSGYRALVASGPWFGQTYPQSERLKSSLAIGRPDEGLDKDYRAFYDFTVGLRGGTQYQEEPALRGVRSRV